MLFYISAIVVLLIHHIFIYIKTNILLHSDLSSTANCYEYNGTKGMAKFQSVRYSRKLGRRQELYPRNLPVGLGRCEITAGRIFGINRTVKSRGTNN